MCTYEAQHHPGSLCQQRFLKAQSWDHFSSWHTQLISRIVHGILRKPVEAKRPVCINKIFFLRSFLDASNDIFRQKRLRHPIQCYQFADDTALTTVSSSPRVCEEHLQQSVTATSTWLSNWRLTVNVEKTVTMAFKRRPFPSKVSINLNGNALSTVNEHRYLGLILSSDLHWSVQIDKILSKSGHLLYTIIRLRCTLSRKAFITYYSLYIRPVVEYAFIAYSMLCK